MNQRMKAAATIQRIADSGLDIDTQDYRALAEIAAWLARIGQKPIVCLCGSTRFSQAFHEANLRETLEGRIVLSIGCDFKSDTDLLLAGELTPEDKERLDQLHLHKISLADEVLVLNRNGYIGASTTNEIAHALAHNKPIRWLEEDQAPGLLTIEEIREAYRADEILEYHITGNENDPSHHLPEPGWYPCVVTFVDENGNVEIVLTDPDLNEQDAIVLNKNIPIAFRRIAAEPPMSSGEMLQAIREETDEPIPSLAELINLD